MDAGVAICLLGLMAALACSRPSAPPPDPPAAARPEAGPVADARVLLSLPTAAYHASIAADADDVAYLLTGTAAYRLAPDRPPAERPMDLGHGATVTRSSIVYWSRRAVFEAPKAGGAARRLVTLAERPQLFVASEAGIAWLQHARDGAYSLNALVGKKPTPLYTSRGSIDAVTMVGEQIFFVERPAGKDWRIGRIRWNGGTPEFTAPRGGRAPAMLAGRSDLVFYDGNRLEVRRLSLDLQHERTPVSGFICSPVAVSETRIYCAQPEGIFELRPDERPRRLVSGDAQRPVTDLAATPRRLLWIGDAGADKLEVRALPLPP